MATPLGFSDFFGFVCTPRHNTYHNIKKHSRFSVSFVKPDQILLTSLAATPRCAVKDFPEEITNHIPTVTLNNGASIFVKDSYVMLDCSLYKIIDGFDDYSLITGRWNKQWSIKIIRSFQTRVIKNRFMIIHYWLILLKGDLPVSRRR